MIEERLLSRGECAACRQCCVFDSYDLWDTPVITDEVMERVLALDPSQRFSDISGRRLFVMEREPDSDMHYCPMLDRKSGCRLGGGKPFDCKIFPFRPMLMGGHRVIAVSPVCPAFYEKPFGQLLEEARRLAPVIFAETDREPTLLRLYQQGYPILVTE